ncbi:MAG: hypothetical protein JSW41_04410 [Candidatus Aenigmatarchaeota archaeon]|nr:MAG: hypothetical protein JSW41_04410 [Candidatus Aenigmarchaeota archaeon]
MQKLRKKALDRLRNEVVLIPVDPGSFGATRFRVELSRPLEKRAFEDAVAREFWLQLANGPDSKQKVFHLHFSFRMMPKEVWGRIIQQLLKMGHVSAT